MFSSARWRFCWRARAHTTRARRPASKQGGAGWIDVIFLVLGSQGSGLSHLVPLLRKGTEIRQDRLLQVHGLEGVERGSVGDRGGPVHPVPFFFFLGSPYPLPPPSEGCYHIRTLSAGWDTTSAPGTVLGVADKMGTWVEGEKV